MGAWGSGRWGWHDKATTVEDCRVLDLGPLARKGAFVLWYSGSVNWLRGEEVVSSIGYTVRPCGDGLALHLAYRMTQSGENVHLPIRLETTPVHFGGRRWWGICPLVVNGQSCNRRVGKLYLPPGGQYFGCRRCYRLTYRSVQEHDKRIDVLRKHPAALEALLRDPALVHSGRALVALRAADAILGRDTGRITRSKLSVRVTGNTNANP
jgi:hypothetical protein